MNYNANNIKPLPSTTHSHTHINPTLLTNMQTVFCDTCANNALSLFLFSHHSFPLFLNPHWMDCPNKQKQMKKGNNNDDNLLIWFFSNNNELVLTEWMTRGHLQANKRGKETNKRTVSTHTQTNTQNDSKRRLFW